MFRAGFGILFLSRNSMRIAVIYPCDNRKNVLSILIFTTMKIKMTAIFVALTAVLSALSTAFGARAGDSFAQHRQNIDNMLVTPYEEGAVARKEPGFIFNRRNKEKPEVQLASADSAFKAGNYKAAAGRYDVLVRSYPFSQQAAKAQLGLANSLAKRRKYDKAFNEYYYLLLFYPDKAPVDEVLDKMFTIANFNLGENGRELGVDEFVKITKVAPGWKRIPEVYYSIGLARLKRKKYFEAAEAFDTITTMFPKHSLAVSAAEKHFFAIYELSLKYKEDDAIQRRAVNLAHAALKVSEESSPDCRKIKEYLKELIGRRIDKAYEIAKFYDTDRYATEVAVDAYREFIRNFPNTIRAKEAQARIEQLTKLESQSGK